jgi:hypothetical protein
LNSSLHYSPLSSLPHFWNSFNRSHFSIFIHEYIVFTPYSPATHFPYIFTPTHTHTSYQLPRQDLFSLPVLHFWKQAIFIFGVEGRTGAWGQGLYLEPVHQPFFFCARCFWNRFLHTICPTTIFLISSSWVTGITVMSQWCPAHFCFIKIVIQDVSLWHFHIYVL